jgi:hypothetical protein
VSLDEFVGFAETARQSIPSGRVDWSRSPLAWMRHHGPRTKSKLGRDIVREWLRARPAVAWAEPDEDELAHFVIGERAVVVHLAVLGKDGHFEFSQLREPGMGVDLMLLVGVEPERARIWAVRPDSVVDFPGYGIQKRGYHCASFDPEEPPDWLLERARWEVNGDDPQGRLFGSPA